MPLLFWTCANEVTPISQAKRFYPLFAILGNLGPIASGQTMAYVSRNRPAGMDAEMAFERTLKVCVLCVCVCFFLPLLAYPPCVCVCVFSLPHVPAARECITSTPPPLLPSYPTPTPTLINSLRTLPCVLARCSAVM